AEYWGPYPARADSPLHASVRPGGCTACAHACVSTHEHHQHGRRMTMTQAGTTALGAMTGARYIDSLKDGREIWMDGQKIHDVTTHPAFTGMVHELARIYDLQHTEAYRDQMTFISPATGHRCSVSWLLPRSLADLKLKRRNSEIWNEQCWGQLGRGPDILAPDIITLFDIREAPTPGKNPHCAF